jgi:dienelactone hydrolase
VFQTKAIMATKPQIPADFIVYPNTNHGFAVRGDETTQAQREQCQMDVVNFFRRTLSSA